MRFLNQQPASRGAAADDHPPVDVCLSAVQRVVVPCVPPGTDVVVEVFR
jgi:hypothetical protein